MCSRSRHRKTVARSRTTTRSAIPAHVRPARRRADRADGAYTIGRATRFRSRANPRPPQHNGPRLAVVDRRVDAKRLVLFEGAGVGGHLERLLSLRTPGRHDFHRRQRPHREMHLIAAPSIVVAIGIPESKRHEALLERRNPPGIVRRREIEQRDACKHARRSQERLRHADRIAGPIGTELPATHRLDVGVIEPTLVEDRARESERGREPVDRTEPVFPVGGARGPLQTAGALLQMHAQHGRAATFHHFESVLGDEHVAFGW